jgi:hypothetical protein
MAKSHGLGRALIRVSRGGQKIVATYDVERTPWRGTAGDTLSGSFDSCSRPFGARTALKMTDAGGVGSGRNEI